MTLLLILIKTNFFKIRIITKNPLKLANFNTLFFL
jgi:hypothetical protein